MDYRRFNAKARKCKACEQTLEIWEEEECETCKLLDALHEPDVIELIPGEMKKVAAEVK